MVVHGICIGDIHFGITPNSASKRIYEELIIFKEFIKNNRVDVIHINGDFFERKLSLAEPTAIYAMKFFEEIKEICIENNIKLRIIHGTEGHDVYQTELFKVFEEENFDMKIFNTVEEEELFPNFNVLYLPEESILNSDEYYKIYREKQYDALMGHGAWDFTMPHQVIREAQRTDVKNSPVFIYSEWENTIKDGFAVFSHIHRRITHKKKVYYPGAFSAWDFTDISKRGFLYYIFDTETKHKNIRLVNNDLAPVYKSMHIDKLNLNLEECNLEDIVELVKPLSEAVDFFRLEIDNLPLEKYEILKGLFKDHPNISLRDLMTRKISTIMESTTHTNKYDYILKNETSMVEQILRFIKEDMIDFNKADTITAEIIEERVTEEST